MVVDQETLIGAVDRVVQDLPVEAQLDSGALVQGVVQRQCVAHPSGHGACDAFLGAALSYVRAVGSAKRDSDFDTTGASVSEYTKDACVFGEKESA